MRGDHPAEARAGPDQDQASQPGAGDPGDRGGDGGGSNWFDHQPYESKIKIMQPAGYEAYRISAVTWRQVVRERFDRRWDWSVGLKPLKELFRPKPKAHYREMLKATAERRKREPFGPSVSWCLCVVARGAARRARLRIRVTLLALPGAGAADALDAALGKPAAEAEEEEREREAEEAAP